MTTTLKQFLLTEKVINLLPKDADEKLKYGDQIFNLLQASYAAIGGIKGNGFNSVEDMVKNVHMWKFVKRGDQITAVALYKEKSGRKRVAIATNKTEQGKKDLAMIVKDDMKHHRAYGEQSKASLSFAIKLLPQEFIKSIAIPIDEVKKILKDDEIREVEPNDYEVEKHPFLAKFFYRRKIGGEWTTKIMMGVPYQFIK